ncbi:MULTISPECIES: glycosyltransferase family 4 protein [unclassified Roseateles]|uniref:glycosyltransferase family 4 protein n=1 Tax=unclassified Roseateles TaxID=2626991 RepID=UPI0006FF9BD6|nr:MULTISPECIES: glycosyltransferase family 4 protein [unclassified Roseateles]KQW43256.1 transferase [Pelomonas sp. Root405]KRA70994.1 transferase [Pelomonas sp. Root662]
MPRRLRILTWHVHGNYLYNLTQVPHDFYLLTDPERTPGRVGRVGTLPWGPNVHEAPVEQVEDMDFDVVLYQHRVGWESDRLRWLSPAQQKLPRIYLEHDPPQQHPTNERHWVQDPGTLLVHCSHFNALMWDAGETPSRVIEHGVKPVAEARYVGDKPSGLVVINQLGKRGRRLGLDLYLGLRHDVPLTLAGMESETLPGGIGEVSQLELPQLMASHRFYFHPVRYTSLGLALIEAMMVGQPVIGLATTELATVIQSGDNGFIDNRPAALADAMRQLLREPELARSWGARGRQLAQQRFNIDRFVGDWLHALHEVTT